MDELETLLASLEACDGKIDALLANDELTDEQKTEHAALQTERAGILAKVEKENQKAARAAEREKLAAEAETRRASLYGNRGRRTQADPPRIKGPANRKIIGPEETKIPRSVLRQSARKLEFFKGKVEGVEPHVRAYRFGQWARCMLSLQMPNRFQFGNSLDWAEDHMPEIFGAASGSNDQNGTSYLVPDEFGLDLIDLREKFGVVRGLFKRVPMKGDKRKDPRRKGGLTAYFVGENGQGTESNLAWDSVELDTKDLMVISRMSNQVDQDSEIDLGDRLIGEISYAYSDKEDDCGFNGDGTAAYGHIVGVRTRLANFDNNGTASIGLQSGSGNAWSALVLKDFTKPVGILTQQADNDRTCWIMHRTFFYTVCVPLMEAAGGVTMSEIGNGGRSGRPMFQGYPVQFAQKMPSTSASGQVCALLGDFTLGASFGDRQADEIAFSDQAVVNGDSLWERNQIGIRGIERFDINVHDVGSDTVPGPIAGLKTT